ncbi:putative phosphoglycerate mutase [Hyphodiscus hymeniophilus]|uniref:Phosphoglycerate mutase n=1 Tax=Hyphodiscus hymeniophilus TaxID=353542 RepID=A0A9P6VRB0_9HELO|nr:putative phosphoglycerate mutase [Hyphodiscus hymeniophilus]
MMHEPSSRTYTWYSTVPGFFLQDDPTTDSEGFDFTTANFGLISREYDTDPSFDPERKKTQWQRFEDKVSSLNQESGDKVQYKVLFMGRHGEGYHNVAESFYGTKAWDCYWSLKDGNDEMTWADAHLTPAGIEQALKAHAFWASLLADQYIPAPESYYTSPLTRCLDTANHTFSGLALPKDRPFVPVIKELFREAIGIHTCDRRSSKTFIAQRYPDWHFESQFAESDPLWKADLREGNRAMDERSKAALDSVFENDQNTWISISSHSGEIGSLLRGAYYVLNSLRLSFLPFGLGTGQVIPVLVKAETLDGTAPKFSGSPGTTPSACMAPPTS